MKYAKLKLLLSLVILIIASMLVSQLEIESNMEDMLPEDSASLMATNEFIQYFEGDDQVVILIKAKDEILDQKEFENQAQYFMKDLADALETKSYIHSILYKMNRSDIQPYSWAYVDMTIYEAVQLAIKQEDMATVKDILSELENSNEREEEIYITNDSKSHYMMLLKPNIDASNFMASRLEFYDGIYSVIDGLENNYPLLDIGMTGGAFIQDLEGDEVAFKGLFSTLVVTLLLILFVVILFFGRLKLPLLAMYPLILGTILAATAGYLIYGALNMFSVSFALLLIGLGIDFAVHLIARYQEERLKNNTLLEAIRIATRSTGGSMIIGAGTTAFAFLSFALAKFKAFEQMGIISAIGIVSLCVVMLILIPALIQLFDKKSLHQPNKVSFKWLEVLTQKNVKYPYLLGGILLVMVISLAINVFNVKVQGDLTAVYPDNIPSARWTQELKNVFDYDVNTITFYVDSMEKLEESVEAFSRRNDIAQVETIRDYLPKDQETKLTIIKELEEALKENNIDVFDEFILEKMTYEDLPDSIKDNFVGKEGKLRGEIVPKVNIFDNEHYERLVAGVIEVTGHHPVGFPTMMNEITELVKTDMLRISMICMGVVFILCWIGFKKLKLALITITPLLMTLYVTIGLLPLLGIEINIFSVAAFPLIIGMGIDSSIHLVHRLITTDQLTIPEKVKETGQPILLTALTTMIGFGSLANINHPGMSSLGLIVALGMFVSVVMTLTIIPVGVSLSQIKK